MENHSRHIQQSPVTIKEEPFSDIDDIVVRIDPNIEDIKQESEDTSHADATNAQNNCGSLPVILKIPEVKRDKGRPRRKIALKKLKGNCEGVKQQLGDILLGNKGTNVTNRRRPKELTKESFLENLKNVVNCQEPVGLSEKMNLYDDHDSLLAVSKVTELKRGRGRPRVLMKRGSTENLKIKGNREIVENNSEDMAVCNENVIHSQVFKSGAIYYKCKICFKPYKTFEDLRSHNRIHKGNNLQCKDCNRLYLRWDHLYKHQISQHNFSEQKIKLKTRLDVGNCKRDTDKANNNLIQRLRRIVESKLENFQLKSGDGDDGSALQVARRKRRRRALRKWNGVYRVPPKEVKNFPKVENNSARNNKIHMCSLVEKYDVDGNIIGVECEACSMYFRYLEDWRAHRSRCSLELLNHASLESADELKLPSGTCKRKVYNICNSPYFLRRKVLIKKEDSNRSSRLSSLHNLKKRRRQRVKRSPGQSEAGVYRISQLDPSCKEDFMTGMRLMETPTNESSSDSDE